VRIENLFWIARIENLRERRRSMQLKLAVASLLVAAALCAAGDGVTDVGPVVGESAGRRGKASTVRRGGGGVSSMGFFNMFVGGGFQGNFEERLGEGQQESDFSVASDQPKSDSVSLKVVGPKDLLQQGQEAMCSMWKRQVHASFSHFCELFRDHPAATYSAWGICVDRVCAASGHS